MSYSFINPYNFMPLGQKEPDRNNDADKREGDLYSGRIKYSICTKTPLFIPNTSYDKVFEESDMSLVSDEKDKAKKKKDKYHKSYDFFSYEDLDPESQSKEYQRGALYTPIIPGSEMRGVIRSQYEMLTNSCMFAIDDEVLSRRNDEVFTSGLIHRVKGTDGTITYSLYKASDCLLRTFGANNLDPDTEDWNPNYVIKKGKKEYTGFRRDNKYDRKCYVQDKLKEGQRIQFASISRGDRIKDEVSKINKGDKEGYVIKGEDGPGDMKRKDGEKEYAPKNQKHCIHVFELDKSKTEAVCQNLDLKPLEALLRIYGEGENKYSEYKEQLEKFKKGKGEAYYPVYYSRIENGDSYYMLSPAAITREVYKNRLGEILKKQDNHVPCDGKSGLCPACRLFGMLAMDGSKVAVTSKLRFSDLTTELPKEQCYAQKVTLKELSSPKLGNVEFYLMRENGAVFWTYDYYSVVEKNRMKVKRYTPKINGRKIYWHHSPFDINNACSDKITERNKTVRPVKNGVKFTGWLYFDRIEKSELDFLVYLLNAGSPGKLKEPRHGYKLGAAKPLGLGSIAIRTEEITIKRTVTNDKTCRIENVENEYDEYETPKIAEETKVLFEEITCFERNNDKIIDYPRTEKGGDIFEWFTKNHSGYNFAKKITASMKNKRDMLFFQKFLQAGEPEVQETGFLAMVSSQNAENGGARDAGTGHGGKTPGNRSEKRIGVVYSVVTQDHLKDKKGNLVLLRVRFEDGTEERLHMRVFANGKRLRDATEILLNQEYKIIYRGVNANGYPDWKLTK